MVSTQEGNSSIIFSQEMETLTEKSNALSQASQVALVVKNPPQCSRHGFDPCVQKTPLEKKMAAHFNILAWRIPMGRGA